MYHSNIYCSVILCFPDIEAPVFTNCSSDPIYINVGHGGIIPVEIPLPVANDNSGLPPYYTYLPEDFRLPYLFRNVSTHNIFG